MKLAKHFDNQFAEVAKVIHEVRYEIIKNIEKGFFYQ